MENNKNYKYNYTVLDIYSGEYGILKTNVRLKKNDIYKGQWEVKEISIYINGQYSLIA